MLVYCFYLSTAFDLVDGEIFLSASLITVRWLALLRTGSDNTFGLKLSALRVNWVNSLMVLVSMLCYAFFSNFAPFGIFNLLWCGTPNPQEPKIQCWWPVCKIWIHFPVAFEYPYGAWAYSRLYNPLTSSSSLRSSARAQFIWVSERKLASSIPTFLWIT